MKWHTVYYPFIRFMILVAVGFSVGSIFSCKPSAVIRCQAPYCMWKYFSDWKNYVTR